MDRSSPPHITLDSLLAGLRKLMREQQKDPSETPIQWTETEHATLIKACRDFELINGQQLRAELIEPLFADEPTAFGRLLTFYDDSADDEESFIRLHGLGERYAGTNRKAFNLYAKIAAKAGKALPTPKPPRSEQLRCLTILITQDGNPLTTTYHRRSDQVPPEIWEILQALQGAIARDLLPNEKKKGSR